MEPGAVITENGYVIANFKKVTGFTDFDKKDNNGYFFPVSLGKQYEGKEKTVKRIKPGPETSAKSNDQDWVLHVDKNKVFTFEVDGKEILRLDFSLSTFQA